MNLSPFSDSLSIIIEPISFLFYDTIIMLTSIWIHPRDNCSWPVQGSTEYDR